jgi:hypothetical protein
MSSTISAHRIEQNKIQETQLNEFGLTKSRVANKQQLLIELFPVLNEAKHFNKRFNVYSKTYNPDAAIELKIKFSNHLTSRWLNIFNNFSPFIEIDNVEIEQSASFRAGTFVRQLEQLIATKSYDAVDSSIIKLRELRPSAFELTTPKPGCFSQANLLSREIIMTSKRLIEILDETTSELNCHPINSKLLYSLSMVDPSPWTELRSDYYKSFDFNFSTTDPCFTSWSQHCYITQSDYTVQHSLACPRSKVTKSEQVNLKMINKFEICGTNHKQMTYKINYLQHTNNPNQTIHQMIPTGMNLSNRDIQLTVSKETINGIHSLETPNDFEEYTFIPINTHRSCKTSFMSKKLRCELHNFPTSGRRDNIYDSLPNRVNHTITIIDGTIEYISPFIDPIIMSKLLIRLSELKLLLNTKLKSKGK